MKRWQKKYSPGSQHGNLLILSVKILGQTALDTVWEVRCLLCNGINPSAEYHQLIYRKARCRECWRRSLSKQRRARIDSNYTPRPVAEPKTIPEATIRKWDKIKIQKGWPPSRRMTQAEIEHVCALIRSGWRQQELASATGTLHGTLSLGLRGLANVASASIELLLTLQPKGLTR